MNRSIWKGGREIREDEGGRGKKRYRQNGERSRSDDIRVAYQNMNGGVDNMHVLLQTFREMDIIGVAEPYIRNTGEHM